MCVRACVRACVRVCLSRARACVHALLVSLSPPRPLVFPQYEPELFPGLIYRMVQPKVVLLIFVSGKVVLTGGKVTLLVNFELGSKIAGYS